MIWQLPAFVCENELFYFLSQAGEYDESSEPITLDFQYVRYWMPAPIVYICGIVCRWLEKGRIVACQNHQNCKAFSYLQRMDFFVTLGIDLPETFRRHPAGSSFVEIAKITQNHTRLIDELTQKLAACLAGENAEDARQLAEFTFGEIIANVQQHSLSSGFCCAQYATKHDLARIGVADAGIGILESFRWNNAPAYTANPQMSHIEALRTALRPWVSSRKHLRTGPYGDSPNRGVGLNMVQNMISESVGELIVASGDAMVRFCGEQDGIWSNLPYPIPGTLVSILFPRGNVPAYHHLLASAQTAINLFPDGDDDRYFV